MKSNMKIRHTMILSVIFNVLHFSCVHAPKQSLHPLRKIDSIAIAYGRSRYVSFADVTSQEFITLRHNWLCIRDSDTIRYLSDRIYRLVSVRDSLTPDVDTRIMLVLYPNYGNNDSLFISALPNHPMQLNNITKLEDSVLWIQFRDAICIRDSIFNSKFNNAIGYY